MIPAFTIGMLGGCANGRSMARYFEEVASHYLRTFPRVRYLFSITTEQDRSVVPASFGVPPDASRIGGRRDTLVPPMGQPSLCCDG